MLTDVYLSIRCKSVECVHPTMSDWTGKQPGLLAGQIGVGGAYRDRTDDPLLAKQMLSQLS